MTAAGKLKVGDVIGPGFLPASTLPATVVWVDPYRLNGWDWTFVVWQYPNGGRQGDGYQSDHDIPTLTPTIERLPDGGFGPGDRFLYALTHPAGVIRAGTVLQWVPPSAGQPAGCWFVELDETGSRAALKTWLPAYLMLPEDATEKQVADAVEARRVSPFPAV